MLWKWGGLAQEDLQITKEYTASSSVHWWGLSDRVSVFWLKPKYCLSTVLLPASQSSRWWAEEHWNNILKKFLSLLISFSVLYYNILVKLRSILGPQKSGVAFWLFIWPYVLMFQWLPQCKISVKWGDQCLRAFQSQSNRSRLLRPDENCGIIRADLVHSTGCRQLEINLQLFSLSRNAAHWPRAGGGFLCAWWAPLSHQSPGLLCQAMQVLPFPNMWRKHQDIKSFWGQKSFAGI